MYIFVSLSKLLSRSIIVYHVLPQGGVCIRHGAVKEYKRCLVEGCKSRPVGKEGVCNRHAGVDLTLTGEFRVLEVFDSACRYYFALFDVVLSIIHSFVRSFSHTDILLLLLHFLIMLLAGPATDTTASNGQEQGKHPEQRQDFPTGLKASQPQTRDAPPPKTASKSRKKKCSVQTCTKQAKVGGLCMKHGGKVKYRFCNAPNCGNVTQKGGYCKRHFNDLVGNKKRKLSEVEDTCIVVGSGGGKV